MEKRIRIKCVVIAAVLVAVTTVGIIFGAVYKKKPAEIKAETVKEDQTYEMPKVMSFSAQTLEKALQSGKQSVDVKVEAIVSPSTAANKEVDFSTEWAISSSRKDEKVSDYLTVTQDSDGSTTATVSCYKAFTGDKILITVTTRDGGFKAVCTANFVGIASDMTITSAATKKTTADRGEFYELGTNKTYDFNINLANVFNSVGTPTYEITIGASGSLYFGNYHTAYDSGLSHFTDIAVKPISEYKDRFITSATIKGNVLTVTTGEQSMENFYTHMEISSVDGVVNDGDCKYNRFVFVDEYDLFMDDDYDKKAEDNQKRIKSCYFTVTIKEALSGLTQTLRFWVEESVTKVQFAKSNLTF